MELPEAIKVLRQGAPLYEHSTFAKALHIVCDHLDAEIKVKTTKSENDKYHEHLEDLELEEMESDAKAAAQKINQKDDEKSVMDAIVMAPDGSYVDLSKVVAITKTDRLPSDYKIKFGFDIYFTLAGIPFKQDNCFKICIAIEYNKSEEYKEAARRNIEATTQGQLLYEPAQDDTKTLQEFVQECGNDLEQKRLKFVEVWKDYRNQQ